MRGDNVAELPEDLRWAADHFFGEDCECHCSFGDPQEENHICETCFLSLLLIGAAKEIERLRAGATIHIGDL